MKSFVVLAFFVTVASASVGLGGVAFVSVGNAHVITNVRTIHPLSHHVITPVITPVIRHVVTPVVTRVISPVVVNTPVLTSVPVHAPVYTSSHIGLSSYGSLNSAWKK